MTTSVATIAEGVLRRLNVAVVPVADLPWHATAVQVPAIVDAALQALGVPVPAPHPPGVPTIITVDTIATAVLTELGVIAADETPSPSDMTLAQAKVNAVHDDMMAQGIVSWAVSAIPQAVAEEYTKLAAAMSASSFGKVVDPAIVAMLEGRVRKVSQIISARDRATQAVLAVHDSLVSQASAAWTNNMIPQALFDEYVRLTSIQLAPIFGVAADPAIVPALEARVRRYQAVIGAPDAANNAVMDIHNDLSMRGIVRWTVWDIPDSAADAYEKLAASQLLPLFAGMFDAKLDPNAVPLAERQLARMIALPTSGIPVQIAYF
jgi:hypothetical protein